MFSTLLIIDKNYFYNEKILKEKNLKCGRLQKSQTSTVPFTHHSHQTIPSENEAISPLPESGTALRLAAAKRMQCKWQCARVTPKFEMALPDSLCCHHAVNKPELAW